MTFKAGALRVTDGLFASFYGFGPVPSSMFSD
jgi:hypothetical protein